MDPILDQPEKIIELNYATFGVRFGAAFIDRLILYTATSILIKTFWPDPQFIAIPRLSYGLSEQFIGGIIFGWLYFALRESSPRQATIGKSWLGIRVCTEEGDRISFINASARYFAKILSALILFIGFFMVIFDKRKQGLHDKLAKTVVVYK